MSRCGPRWMVTLIVVLLVAGGAVASAQDGTIQTPAPEPIDSCPIERVCVEYQGAILEFDPACGPVVSFVTTESLARTTDLAGVTESYGVAGVVLIETAAGYEVAGEFSRPATGPLDGVRFGSVGCLDWGVSDE